MKRALCGMAIAISCSVVFACGQKGRDVELPVGTVVTVRLDQALSTVRNRQGDSFEATLEEPVLADGLEILERGTPLSGHVTESAQSGHLEGRGVLGITLDAVDLHGQHYALETSLDTRTTEAHRKRNIELIGGGAGVGALIGAVAGGGKGAGIGAAVGAGGGTVAAASTGQKQVEVPAGTIFRFSLRRPVTIHIS